MKKLYTLLFSVVPFLLIGQNLVTNPSFNDGLTGWTSGPSASYTAPTIVAGDGSDGSNSATYVATATTGFYQEIPVSAGDNLVISFWYKATGDDTDARIWSNYKDASGTIIYQDAATATDPLRNNNGYLPSATTWTQHTINVTAPAAVTTLVLAVRAYNGGTASFDQFSVEVTAGLKDNNISGFSMYPNPLKGNTLNFSSNANAAKSVQIFDVLGKEVVRANTMNNAVNVANLNAGVYIVKVTEEGKTATRKLVVQ